MKLEVAKEHPDPSGNDLDDLCGVATLMCQPSVHTNTILGHSARAFLFELSLLMV